MSVSAISSWRIDCSAGHLEHPGPLTHVQAVHHLEITFRNLYHSASAPKEREDLSEAIAKVHALKPEQSTQFTIVLANFPRPVVWSLVKERVR